LGIRVKIKVVKNKVAAPFKVVELDILFGKGIDKMGSLLDAALDLGVVQSKGSWYSYQDTNFAYLKENKDVAKNMEAELQEVMLTVTAKIPSTSSSVDTDDESILFDDEMDPLLVAGSSILE